MDSGRILIVEDDVQLRNLLALAVRRLGGHVHAVGDGLTAMQLLQERDYAVVILDLRMPLLNGYDVVVSLRDLKRRPAVIVATGVSEHRHGELDPAIVTAMVRKPFDLELLAATAVETARSFQRASELSESGVRRRLATQPSAGAEAR